MIKIEKINNNGVVSLNEVDYTVETNFKPKISPNSFLFNNYCVDVEDDGFYCENNHKGNSTHDGYCAFTQQVFKPFECGSLVLKNKSIHSLGAIDILESNNKSNPEGVLAVADISLGWFNTTDSFRGTHNPAESYTKYTENGIEINSVFEFHEKSSVGEINEIELYSKPINVPSESNARNALASRGATDFSSGSMSFIDPKCSMQLTQSGYNVNPYTTNVHFDGEGNLYRYFSNVSGEVLQVKLVDGSEFFVKDCLSNIAAYKEMLRIDRKYGQKTATNIPALKRLAMLYEKQGRFEDAVNVCKQAYSLGMDERSRMARMIKKAGRKPTQEEQSLFDK